MGFNLGQVFSKKQNEEQGRMLSTITKKPSSANLAHQIQHSPKAFWEFVDLYYESLFHYFIIRTGGDYTQTVEMTAYTFWAALHRHTTMHREGLPTWLFGLAWDVLNEHRQSSDTQPAPIKLDGVAINRDEMQKMIKCLRKIPFYPRETIYLRFFAALPVKDIGVLMDRNETAMKMLVLSGLMLFEAGLEGRTNPSPTMQRPHINLFATLYDQYLTDIFAGNTPYFSIPIEFIRPTNRLQSLRNALSPNLAARTAVTEKLRLLIASRHRNRGRL